MYIPVVFLYSTWYFCVCVFFFFFFFILTILVAMETFILISLLTREGEYLYVYLSMRDISCLQMEYPML